MDEICGDFIVRVIFQAFLTGATILIDKLIVRRRPAIVHRGRQLQAYLRLPEWMHIFASRDPGIQNEDLLVAAQFLGVACFLAMCGWIRAFALGIFWDFWVLGLMFVAPACTVIVAWFILVGARRKWLSRARYRNIADDPEKGVPPDEPDPYLERSIMLIWVHPWL
ncbi:hypothetical protein F5Y05DRAFT_361963 [Hypoxylon sp. FL0543]|nr:hypothetical protein F5Y05DRAFT_361963 [Hypoxylon sp. FL0543]